MVKVYFQSIAGSHSELVAVFSSEKIYQSVIEALEIQAANQRCIITESVDNFIGERAALTDAIDELELNLNIVDDADSIQAYNLQLETLRSTLELLTDLDK